MARSGAARSRDFEGDLRTVSVTIDSIAAGGDGVGRSDGLVVFVPRTAPGDIATVRIAGKGHFARGSLRTLVRPSEDRVAPSCPHYTQDRCGGCQIQHMSYASQVVAKQRVIVDAMQRIGKRDVAMPAMRTGGVEWRYRAKLTLALRRKGGNWIAGLHAYDDPGHVFALTDCPITERRVVLAWRDVMGASQLFPDGLQLRGSVRWTDAGPIFVLIGGRRWTQADRFFEAVPSFAAVYWEPDEQPRMLVGDRRTESLPAASFMQVNPVVADQLRAYVLERVLAYTPRTVVDAYAGNGDLALALAQRGVAVTAIELDAEAAAWSEARLPEHSRSVRARVEDVLAKYLPADVVVLNPPRAGVHESVSHLLQRAERPRTIIYVSCDPATLARDVARLPNYDIASMIAFDMFPQTAHVETVCELVARDA